MPPNDDTTQRKTRSPRSRSSSSRSRSRTRARSAEPDSSSENKTTETTTRSKRSEPKTKSGRTIRTRRGAPEREAADSTERKSSARKTSTRKTSAKTEPKRTEAKTRETQSPAPKAPESRRSASGDRSAKSSKPKETSRSRSEEKPRTESRRSRSKAPAKEAGKSARSDTPRSESRSRPSRKSPSGTKVTKTILFSEEAGYEVAAIREGKRLIHFWVQEERRVDTGQAGNVYRGIVGKVLPALNAAFVDIGVGKDGFLSFDELGPEIYRQRKSGKKSRFERIDHVLREGDAVMVQVAKEAIGDKGASLTTKMSFPGRFVVYMPFNNVVRMSRQLSAGEKKNLSKMMERQTWLDGGVIVRTAAHQRTEDEIEHDFQYLKSIWQHAQEEFGKANTPRRLHQELNLFERVIRDHLQDEVNEVVLYHPRLKYRIKQFLREVAPGRNSEELLIMHSDSLRSIWSTYNLEREIDQLFGNIVSLDCGGYLIIEELETLTAIDINSGSNIDRNNLEATIRETNVEAAVEVARQLRLRQIGGIIIVDFIDMTNTKHQEEVFKTLEAELEKDRVPSNIQQFTELGLIQITRQRTGKSLTKRLTFECPHCSGSGRLPSIALTKRIQQS